MVCKMGIWWCLRYRIVMRITHKTGTIMYITHNMHSEPCILFLSVHAQSGVWRHPVVGNAANCIRCCWMVIESFTDYVIFELQQEEGALRGKDYCKDKRGKGEFQEQKEVKWDPFRIWIWELERNGSWNCQDSLGALCLHNSVGKRSHRKILPRTVTSVSQLVGMEERLADSL